MLQKILFTHTDLDGAGCRIIFSLANYLHEANTVLVVNCENTNVDTLVHDTCFKRDDVNNKTEIYFGDICASREILEELKDHGFNVKIFDHHRTNLFATWIFEDAKIIPENELGIPECGTSLMFKAVYDGSIESDPAIINEYFNSEIIEKFVECVRQWDTYQWREINNLEPRYLQILFDLLGMESFCKVYLSKLTSNLSMSNMIENKHTNESCDLISEHDMMFINARMNNLQKAIDGITDDTVYDIEIWGLKAAFVLSKNGADISELGNQFLTKYPNYDIIISFTLFGDGSFSFRTIRDDLNIGEIVAEKINGGGHPKAAGAPLPDHIKNSLAGELLYYLSNDFKCNRSPYGGSKED